MKTDFLSNYTEADVAVGSIARHPEVQRRTPLAAFFRKCGQYDSNLNLSPLLLVEANSAFLDEGENDVKYFAVDGATRAEAAMGTKGYGPDTTVRARIYANGRLPTNQELAELFLAANVQRNNVSAVPVFKVSLIAGRQSAIVAAELAKKLGPESKAGSGLMALVEKHGADAVADAVNEAAAIWPGERNIIMAAVKSVLHIIQGGKLDRLRQRRSRIRKEGIDKLYQRARLAHYGKNGNRPPVGECLVKILLGVRT